MPQLRQIPQYPPPAPTGDRDSKGQLVPQDDAFLSQLVQELLPDKAMPRIVSYRQGADFDRTKARTGQAPRTLAYTNSPDSNIYLEQGSQVYQRARAGDANARKGLAGILTHEQIHLRPGQRGEAEPYAEQLAFLKALGASKKTIRDVEASRDYEARHSNRRYRI